MSEDKDRGIHRQKQKRAEQNMKAGRQPRVPETLQVLQTSTQTAD